MSIRIALTFAGLLTLTPPAAAQVDSALFRGLSYRLVGPSRGGRVTTVTGVPSQPRRFYMGVASGGVFRTTDGGTNWEPITDGKIPLGSVGSIAVAETDPNIIYVGTGSDGVRSNVSTGRGVYKSTDGGKSWRRVLFVDDKTGAADLAMDPSNPRVLFAAMWRAARKPWTMESGGPSSGLFKSTDGGETWRHAIVPGGELLGEDFCHVRTDSRGTVHLFWEATYEDGKALWYSRSDDRGANFSDPSLLGSHLGCYPTGNEIDFGPMDGILGAVAYTYPSIDIANGAPNGDDATDRMVMVTCENTGGAQAATLRESLDRGATWSAPSVVSEPADRVAMPSVAISPDGAALYLVYLAFLDPWRSTTDEPRRVQAVARRATTGDPGSWSTAYRGSVGDARGSAEPNYDIAEESFALHLDAVAARDGGTFVWTDVRNAEACAAINTYREAINEGQTPDPPAPAAECAASFGNTDIYATTIGSPVQSLRPVPVVKDSARPGVMSS